MLQALAEPLDPGFMNVDQFFAWAETVDGKWQLVDGVPEAMAPVSNRHALVHAELGGLLREHLRATRPECRVAVGPGVTPRIDAGHNVRVPDIIVGCDPSDRGGKTFKCPLLIVAILSPGNRAQTGQNVWSYTTIPSVQEIIVLHTQAIRASVLARGADGGWPDDPTVVEGDELLRVGSLGFSVPLSSIYLEAGLAED